MIFVWPGKILFLLNAELISEVAVLKLSVALFIYFYSKRDINTSTLRKTLLPQPANGKLVKLAKKTGQ